MDNYTDKIIEYLGCPCEIMPAGKNYREIEEWYYTHLEEGKEKQYYPLIIVPSDTLYEMMVINVDDEKGNPTLSMITTYRKKTIQDADKIRAEAFFADVIKPDTEGDSEYAAYLENLFQFEVDKEAIGNLGFNAFVNGSGDTCEVILACIPTKNPWELAAWVPMGGWNDCPAPAIQVAVFKYWNKKFEVYPAVVTGDIWELTAFIMPNETEAKELAIEQYLWCVDIVEQSEHNIAELAGELMDSDVWYFWWD